MTARGKFTELECRLYPRRWLMICLYMLHAFNATIQWAQFSIISNIIIKYYNVSASEVEWTTLVYALSYIIIVYPSLYIIDRLGVRNTLLIGVIGVTVGTWIKLLSVTPDRFFLVLLGQSIVAIFFILTYGLMGRIISVWCAIDEISFAGVLISGDQIGGCITFYFPYIFIKNEDSPDKIENGLTRMNLVLAGMSTVIMLLIAFIFESAPELPPSVAQAKQRQLKKKKNVWENVKKAVHQCSFTMNLLTFGISFGPYMAICTLLNELIGKNFPDQEEHAGNIGSFMMICGTIGAFCVAGFLDKTRQFKGCAIFLSILTSIATICFSWLLKSSYLAYVYITLLPLGAFTLGFFVCAFQSAMEVTYPISENITVPIFFLAGYLGMFLVTAVYSFTVKLYGDTASNIGLCVISVINIFLVIFKPIELKRQKAEATKNEVEMMEVLKK